MLQLMPVTDRLVDRGRRRGRQINRTIGLEVRSARRMAALSQDALGTAVGLSGAEIGRIERDEAAWLSIVQASTILSVVGCDLWARVYPAGPPMRDAAHLRLLDDFEARLPPQVKPRREWPIPLPGDLRAIDLVLLGLPRRTGVEAETFLDDLQALERGINEKRADGNLERMILLVRGSRHNREVLRHASALRIAFPLSTRTVLHALSRARDPGADGIVVL